MKMKWSLTGFLLLVLCAGIQLHAQFMDETNSVESIKAKAENGDIVSQYKIGWMYQKGRGVPQDNVEAVKWYRKGAEQGLALAQYMMGDCYLKGIGVVKDEHEAVAWWRKAADQNFAWAEYKLGLCCEAGLSGVPEDDFEAVKWYRKAAEQGDADAECSLGVLLAVGKGVERDYAEAQKWLGKSAEQGDADGQCKLGMTCQNGEGVPRNYIEAYKWYSLGAAQGDNKSQKLLNAIEHLMTPEQIAEGQHRAAAFVPHKEIANSSSDDFNSPANPSFTGTGFFITDDGYLISNYHVVKAATKVRLLTGAGLIDASVVKVDAANDLALLKAVGRFAPLPIAASRTVKLGGTVAAVGFPDIGLQGFAPKVLAHGHHGGNRVAGGRGG